MKILTPLLICALGTIIELTQRLFYSSPKMFYTIFTILTRFRVDNMYKQWTKGLYYSISGKHKIVNLTKSNLIYPNFIKISNSFNLIYSMSIYFRNIHKFYKLDQYNEHKYYNHEVETKSGKYYLLIQYNLLPTDSFEQRPYFNLIKKTICQKKINYKCKRDGTLYCTDPMKGMASLCTGIFILILF
ncbi:hypothetical protein HZS_2550 [Henneguya salminicola]|nr:hypothetical protein HZS_2550 [Henneguya salminicola]